MRCGPEMSRQREVPRVVVTRPCRPACGHHNSRGCALNQPSRRSQLKSSTSAANLGKHRGDSDMIPEHDPMLRTVARRRTARAAGLWRSSVEAVRSTCKVRATHPGDAAPTGYPYGDLVRPFWHLRASPDSEPDRNQGCASHALICRAQPSSG